MTLADFEVIKRLGKFIFPLLDKQMFFHSGR